MRFVQEIDQKNAQNSQDLKEDVRIQQNMLSVSVVHIKWDIKWK